MLSSRGGAVIPSVARDEDSFASRLSQAEDSKRRLAVAACAQIADGEAVFVDSSTSAYFAVSDLARREKLYMRDAAYAIAIGRVAKACHERGWV